MWCCSAVSRLFSTTTAVNNKNVGTRMYRRERQPRATCSVSTRLYKVLNKRLRHHYFRKFGYKIVCKKNKLSIIPAIKPTMRISLIYFIRNGNGSRDYLVSLGLFRGVGKQPQTVSTLTHCLPCARR